MEPSLSAELLANRDDARRWAVYADWLEAQGNPHGALVSLMLEREVRPTRALAKAVKEREQLISQLTPEPFRTLLVRDLPRLAPVFRRGFIWSAGAADDADFQAMVTHPACSFLERAVLMPSTLEQLEAWLAGASEPLPWRQLHVVVPEGVESVDLSPLVARLPQLQSLSLDCVTELTAFTLGSAPVLRAVTLFGGSEVVLEAVLQASALVDVSLRLSTRNRYEPQGIDRLEPMARQLASVSRLERLVLEGEPGEVVRSLAEDRGATRVAVRAFELDEPPFERWPAGDETCFVALRGALTQAHREALTQFARHAEATRVVATVAEVDVGSTVLSLLRLHGEGEMRLVPRAIANQLAKSDATLDAAAITLSESNNSANAWAVGPHATSEPGRRRSVPARRHDAGFWSRDGLVREVLDGLLGFDPGLDVLDALLVQLDLGVREPWLGNTVKAHERLPLFTDLDARRFEEEEEQDEYDGRDPERTDALDFDEDDDDDWGGAQEEAADAPSEWGGEPIVLPEPVPELSDEVRVLPGAHTEDDDPDDDLDRPQPDAFEAREGDVWNEGPVELPEHHDATIGDPIAVDDDEPPRGHFDALHVPCARCQGLEVLRRCHRCSDDVCVTCAAAGTTDVLDDDGREFLCLDCVERPTAARRVRPRA
ncbi:MAG: hypothetical protein Q8L14_01110 [Myxococcales bacterium]|nr:hypothetical protein [Myxococcales bacterium]